MTKVPRDQGSRSAPYGNMTSRQKLLLEMVESSGKHGSAPSPAHKDARKVFDDVARKAMRRMTSE